MYPFFNGTYAPAGGGGGGVHWAFWVLNRDCYRVRALSWEEQHSFLSASIELSREFWKVFSGLSCLSVFSSLFACGLLWSLGNDPFYLLNVRLPTAPLLPTQRDSCMPSIVCGLLWAFAVIVCMFDQSAYTKVTRPLQNTHNCIKKLFEESNSIGKHTSVTPGKVLFLSFFCITLFCLSGRVVMNHVTILNLFLNLGCCPFTLLRSLAKFGKEIRRGIFNISCCLDLSQGHNIILHHCTIC